MAEWTTILREIGAVIWSYPGVKFISVGVILNLVIALAGAIKDNTFTFRELFSFFKTQLLPYTLIYGVSAWATGGTEYEWIPAAVLGAITVTMTARILDNLGKLGVPIPEQVLRLARTPVIWLQHVPQGDDK